MGLFNLPSYLTLNVISQSILITVVKNPFTLILLLLLKFTESEISLLPIEKSHGVYSCPTIILKVAKCLISRPLMELMNASILEGAYPDKLKLAKVILIFKSGDDSDPNNNNYYYCPTVYPSPLFSIEFQKGSCTNVWSHFLRQMITIRI